MDSIKAPSKKTRVSQIEFWVVFFILLIFSLFAIWQIQNSNAQTILITPKADLDKTKAYVLAQKTQLDSRTITEQKLDLIIKMLGTKCQN